MTTHQEAPLLCPFCGSKDSPKLKPWDGDPPMPGFYVVCDAAGWEGMEGRGCGCSGAYGEDRLEAIAAWNLRSPTLAPSDNGLVERLRVRDESDRIGLIGKEAADALTASQADRTALAAENERLRAELERSGRDCTAWRDASDQVWGKMFDADKRAEAAESRAASLQTLLDKAVEALEPFAEAARNFSFAIGPDGIDDHMTVLARAHARPEFESKLSTADFNRARSTITAVQEARHAGK